jgi:hypothetical protein
MAPYGGKNAIVFGGSQTPTYRVPRMMLSMEFHGSAVMSGSRYRLKQRSVRPQILTA